MKNSERFKIFIVVDYQVAIAKNVSQILPEIEMILKI